MSALLSLSSSPPNRPGLGSAFPTGVAAVAGSITPAVGRTDEEGQKPAAAAADTATAGVAKTRQEAVTKQASTAVSEVTTISATAGGRGGPPFSPIAVSLLGDAGAASLSAAASAIAATTTDDVVVRQNQETETTSSSSSLPARNAGAAVSPELARGEMLLSAVMADVDKIAAQKANDLGFAPVTGSTLVLPASYNKQVEYRVSNLL